MTYQEFNEDNVLLPSLQRDFIEQSLFTQIHENTVIVCHDILIRYKGKDGEGILLTKRLDEPARNVFYPIGGRLLRGFTAEESIQKKVKEECGLEVKNIQYLTLGRTLFKTDPFSHGYGTDTVNIVFIADGVGDIILAKMLEEPIFITKESYLTIRPTLSPYNQAIFDIVEKENLW